MWKNVCDGRWKKSRLKKNGDDDDDKGERQRITKNIKRSGKSFV